MPYKALNFRKSRMNFPTKNFNPPAGGISFSYIKKNTPKCFYVVKRLVIKPLSIKRFTRINRLTESGLFPSLGNDFSLKYMPLFIV